MSGKSLLKSLSKIAAKSLKNTRGISPQWKDKAELVEIAHGYAAVLHDFESWIDSVRDNPPPNPVSEYLKIVDERFGTAVPEAENDPRVTDIISCVYTLTGLPATKASVQKLLAEYSGDEISAAFSEYVSRLDEQELKYSVKNFFHDGGADGIILARRNQKEAQVRAQRIEENAVATALAQAAREREARLLEEQDDQRLVNPFGETDEIIL